MATQRLHSTYQLKITLEDIKPPIWRRVLVADSIKLSDFHLVIQIAMGWENCHLHQFSQQDVLYGEIKEDFEDFGLQVNDETKFRLKDLLKAEKQWLRYEYDFGDGWSHKIVLEKILAYDTKHKLPQCIKGKRACPPENCGGVWGYQEILETLDNPEDLEYENLLEWLGGELEPETFDIQETNELLSEYCR